MTLWKWAAPAVDTAGIQKREHWWKAFYWIFLCHLDMQCTCIYWSTHNNHRQLGWYYSSLYMCLGTWWTDFIFTKCFLQLPNICQTWDIELLFLSLKLSLSIHPVSSNAIAFSLPSQSGGGSDHSPAARLHSMRFTEVLSGNVWA